LKRKLADYLWDAWCIGSVVGIWPRFIEPKLLKTSNLHLKLDSRFPRLTGLKIAHFSDLHWSDDFPSLLGEQLIHKIKKAQPDLILFTGDMLSRSVLHSPARLEELLSNLHASLGSFAVLGNHDYQEFISISQEGNYDIKSPSPHPNIVQGFKRLFQPVDLTRKVTERASKTPPHPDLLSLLEKTPFELLDNRTAYIPYKNSGVNLTGLGDYTAGRCFPQLAFKNYRKDFPGIVLAHNPDSVPLLHNFPGDIILAGHTHGGQVNLPLIWKRFTQIENLRYKGGLHCLGSKRLYVNRGIGSVMKFRWFSPPELTFITIE